LSNEKPRAKRHPVTIRITDETIQLARKLAKLYKEDEKKLGELIEDTIIFYSANREDQSRTNALLKVTEDNLLNQFKEQVESMYREFKTRDKNLAERVASLIAIQSFETTLTELMLKDLFCKDSERQNRYEELRSVAARKMKDRYDKCDMGKIAELQTKISDLEKKLNTNIDTYKRNTGIRDEKIKDLTITVKGNENRIRGLESDLEKLAYYVSNLEELVRWYEKRDLEVPDIQEKNKNRLGMKMSYENALNTYNERSKIPEKEDKPNTYYVSW